MITTGNTLTQTITHTIPVGTVVTSWAASNIALYVTTSGNTRRYQSGITYDAPTTTPGSISCTADIDVSTEGSYRLEFRYEGVPDIDTGTDTVITYPIASTIIRKVTDVNSSTIVV